MYVHIRRGHYNLANSKKPYIYNYNYLYTTDAAARNAILARVHTAQIKIEEIILKLRILFLDLLPANLADSYRDQFIHYTTHSELVLPSSLSLRELWKLEGIRGGIGEEEIQVMVGRLFEKLLDLEGRFMRVSELVSQGEMAIAYIESGLITF